MGALTEGLHGATVERVVLYESGGVAVDAIHARPDGASVTGVVLHPDIMGLRPLFDDLCRRLATHGLAVCAPEPFAHLPEARAISDPAGRMEHVNELDDATQLGDLAAAADFLEATDAVSEVAVLGFCMGGMYTLKAAAAGRFARAVPFYGMLRVPDDWRGPGQREPLETAARVCPTLAILGGADPYTPASDIDALREAWKARDDCDVVVYTGAEHGFVHDPDRPAHRPDDAADAWRRALAFLGVA